MRAYRVRQTAEETRTDYMLTAKTSRIVLDLGAERPEDFKRTFNSKVRETMVFAQSELLEPAERPLPQLLAAGSMAIILDRQVDGLAQEQRLILFGKVADPDRKDEWESEVLTLLNSKPVGDLTRLEFSPALTHSYQRDSVTLYANVVCATHGETVQEILGSGDARQPYQRFSLKRAPLTYASAATPSGAESTLQVWVHDMRWREAPSFYGRGPQERVFVTRSGDDGKTIIEFGDGWNGARLPSGQNNLRATYRSGSGRAGQVKAGQLTLLMTRPLGVKEVTNPLPASGAQDPETRDEARRNAPLRVLTLDRLVTLQDYEDFAYAFPGITKALATWTWAGQTRAVFVTVAGLDGAEVKSDSDLHHNLLHAMRQYGDPYVPMRLASYRRVNFKVEAGIKVAPDYLPERVIAAVTQALRQHFSFAERAFGQPVTLSEVIRVMQMVAGVVAVDIDNLYRVDGHTQPSPALLLAELPQGGTAMRGAELLLLAPDLPELRVMS